MRTYLPPTRSDCAHIVQSPVSMFYLPSARAIIRTQDKSTRIRTALPTLSRHDCSIKLERSSCTCFTTIIIIIAVLIPRVASIHRFVVVRQLRHKNTKSITILAQSRHEYPQHGRQLRPLAADGGALKQRPRCDVDACGAHNANARTHSSALILTRTPQRAHTHTHTVRPYERATSHSNFLYCAAEHTAQQQNNQKNISLCEEQRRELV